MGAPDAAVVLAYHRVGDPTRDPLGLTVDENDFCEQMEHVTARLHPVPLAVLAGPAAAPRPGRAVAVTFDDGYAETVRRVVPVLERLGVPATFFVATERIEDGGEFWWDELEALGGGAAMEAMIAAPLAERERRLAEIRGGRPRPSPRPDRRSLTTAELRHLARRFDIGAHTVHHVSLPAQTEEVARRELYEGRRQLEALVGRPVTALAYPYGRVDARTAALARAAGYAIGVTTAPGTVTRATDPLQIPRREARPWGLARFAAHLDAWLRLEAAA